MIINEQIGEYISALRQQGLYRKRLLSPSNLLHFSSNDYLSFGSDPRVKKAYQKGIEQASIGSGGSMVVCGYHSSHHALERAFADALNVDDCLIFPSGYAANISVIALLARFNTHLLIDKMVHASIYDGLRSSHSNYSRYVHNNLKDLATKLRSIPSNAVLLTEGIFSMSGEEAPLADMVALSKSHVQGLIVDEAHAFGVLGEQGLGAVSQHGLTQEDVPLRIIPLGKAFCSAGAIVAGKGEWIEALLQSARPFIYSTAMSPAVAYGLEQTLDLLRAADDRRDHLYKLIAYCRSAIKDSPWQWRDSNSAIQQLQLGCPERAVTLSDQLREKGIICLAMRQPTVSKSDTGLRVILNYDHQPEDIDYLFECLRMVC